MKFTDSYVGRWKGNDDYTVFKDRRGGEGWRVRDRGRERINFQRASPKWSGFSGRNIADSDCSVGSECMVVI